MAGDIVRDNVTAYVLGGGRFSAEDIGADDTATIVRLAYATAEKANQNIYVILATDEDADLVRELRGKESVRVVAVAPRPAPKTLLQAGRNLVEFLRRPLHGLLFAWSPLLVWAPSAPQELTDLMERYWRRTFQWIIVADSAGPDDFVRELSAVVAEKARERASLEWLLETVSPRRALCIVTYDRNFFYLSVPQDRAGQMQSLLGATFHIGKLDE